ncbi:hypothetical protein EP7_000317 [Isosphaeraceae bacterium EP7]
MRVIYRVTERFDPSCGESWANYIAWSGLTQLREVVSLDGMLCPRVFGDLTDDDWDHNVQEDYKTDMFHDLDYVLGKLAGDDRSNVLALMQNPTADEVGSFLDPRFVFRGFDLMDLTMGISALSNCGGFDRAFAPTDLSDCGLILVHAKALNVQTRLRAEYPDEFHADCDVWAIWQMQRHPEDIDARP